MPWGAQSNYNISATRETVKLSAQLYQGCVLQTTGSSPLRLCWLQPKTKAAAGFGDLSFRWSWQNWREEATRATQLPSNCGCGDEDGAVNLMWKDEGTVADHAGYVRCLLFSGWEHMKPYSAYIKCVDSWCGWPGFQTALKIMMLWGPCHLSRRHRVPNSSEESHPRGFLELQQTGTMA